MGICRLFRKWRNVLARSWVPCWAKVVGSLYGFLFCLLCTTQCPYAAIFLCVLKKLVMRMGCGIEFSAFWLFARKLERSSLCHNSLCKFVVVGTEVCGIRGENRISIDKMFDQYLKNIK